MATPNGKKKLTQSLLELLILFLNHMKFPNKYLRNLKPYKLASHKIWSVKPEERPEILKLDWNESTIPPSPKVAEYLNKILSEPSFFNLYPTTYNEKFLELLSDYTGLPQENLQYFASSDALHEYICKVFISVGDPVMILGPSYDNFRLTCQANGAEVYFSNYEDDFSFNAQKFENDIYAKEPAVVYICNPNNPTGNLHPVSYIRHLLDEFPDTLFLLDEAYIEFSDKSAKELVLEYDNLLISRTFSKAFGIANFRVGYLIASKDNVQFINKVRNPKNVSTFAQTAAMAVLSDVQYMKNYVAEVNKAKAFFVDALKKYEDIYVPAESAGNFVLVKFKDYESKMALLEFLAGKNIFVRNRTEALSVYNCFRITVGTTEQMKVVLKAFDEYYGK